MAYTRVTSSSPFSDGSSTDGTVIVNAIEAGLETVETALGVTNPGSNLKYWAAKTANYTLTATDTVCSFTFTAAAGGTATIPSAVTMGAGKWFTIKNSSVPTTTATTVTTVAPLGKLVNVSVPSAASGSQNQFTVASTTPVTAGMFVVGHYTIPTGAVVLSYSAGVVTLNCNITGTGIPSGSTVSFAVPALTTTSTAYTPTASSFSGSSVVYTIGTHSVTVGQTVTVVGDATNPTNNGTFFVTAVAANSTITLNNPGGVGSSISGVTLYACGAAMPTTSTLTFNVVKGHPIVVGHYIMATNCTNQGAKVTTVASDATYSTVFDTITVGGNSGTTVLAGYHSVVPESREITVASATNIVKGSAITTAPTGITTGTTVIYVTGTTVVLSAAINGTLTTASTTFTNDTPPLSITSSTAIDGQTTITMSGNGYVNIVSDGSVWKTINGQYVNELVGRRIYRWDQIASSGSGAWQTIFYDTGQRQVEPAASGSGTIKYIRRGGAVHISGSVVLGNQSTGNFIAPPGTGYNFDAFGYYRDDNTGGYGQVRLQNGNQPVNWINLPLSSRNNAVTFNISASADNGNYPSFLPGVPAVAVQA